METYDRERYIGAMVLIGLGVIFLVAQLTGWNIIGRFWPFFIIVPGLAFLTGALGDNDDMVGMIFPGTIITATGTILLYQNLTGHWESWAYIWAIYPVLVGGSLMYMGIRTDDTQQIKIGRAIATFAGFTLLGLAALFELFIFGGASLAIAQVIVPLMLIGAGVYLLLRSRSHNNKRKIMD